MNTLHKRHLKVFLLFAAGLSLAFALIIFSLRQNLNVFVTPKELAAIDQNSRASFRLGGVVKVGSVQFLADKSAVSFVVTDFQHDIKVTYRGLLPDLFREGKGVIAEGHLAQGHFQATTVLAKHDENYMPSSTYQALRKKTT